MECRMRMITRAEQTKCAEKCGKIKNAREKSRKHITITSVNVTRKNIKSFAYHSFSVLEDLKAKTKLETEEYNSRLQVGND